MMGGGGVMGEGGVMGGGGGMMGRKGLFLELIEDLFLLPT